MRSRATGGLDGVFGEARSELRRDPIVDRWVIVAEERGRRPSSFVEWDNTPSGRFCPFCPGHEEKTPPEVMAFRSPHTEINHAGWRVRVVPNKFPALSLSAPFTSCDIGLYDRMEGLGTHEIVVESAQHHDRFWKYSPQHVEEVFLAYRERMAALRQDPRLQYILVFKNKGKEAGASLEHPHSQIIATPVVPKLVSEEIAGALRYRERRRRCVYCAMIDEERRGKLRLVVESERFVAFCPFASRFPYETWVLPREHASHFEAQSEAEMAELSLFFREVMERLARTLLDPPYNFLLHTAPCQERELPHYHWHFEIMPKLIRVAGFEWGTGFFINPVRPETAARHLRCALEELAAPVSPAPFRSDFPHENPDPGHTEEG